jgi:hypothetical protein
MAWLGLAALTGLGFGCQLLFSLDDLECNEDEKACFGRCVKRGQPETGCSDNTCLPCDVENARKATCTMSDQGSRCSIAECKPGYEDCNRDDMSCETDIKHDYRHCGGCHAELCRTDNGTPGCKEGTCAIESCNQGWDDCNRDPADGCECNTAQGQRCEQDACVKE